MPPPSSSVVPAKSSVSASSSRKPVDIFEDPVINEFYQIFRNYADSFMTILQHHAVSEMNAMAEEEGETFPKHGSRAYNDIFQSDWKQYLKCARTWDRITLDKEVDRILKRMAGVVADLDDDPSDSEEEQESDIQMDKSELEPYRETLETYIECARWSYMGSLVPNAKTPVDDIPAISLSDFLCYFVAELTKHRAVKKNMFLDYDELNQASVLKPVLIHTLKNHSQKSIQCTCPIPSS